MKWAWTHTFLWVTFPLECVCVNASVSVWRMSQRGSRLLDCSSHAASNCLVRVETGLLKDIRPNGRAKKHKEKGGEGGNKNSVGVRHRPCLHLVLRSVSGDLITSGQSRRITGHSWKFNLSYTCLHWTHFFSKLLNHGCKNTHDSKELDPTALAINSNTQHITKPQHKHTVNRAILSNYIMFLLNSDIWWLNIHGQTQNLPLPNPKLF